MLQRVIAREARANQYHLTSIGQNHRAVITDAPFAGHDTYSGFWSYRNVVGWAKQSVPTAANAKPWRARRAKSAPLPTLQVIPLDRNPL